MGENTNRIFIERKNLFDLFLVLFPVSLLTNILANYVFRIKDDYLLNFAAGVLVLLSAVLFATRIQYLFKTQWVEKIFVEPLFFDLKEVKFEIKKRNMASHMIDQAFKQLYSKNPEIFKKEMRAEKENFNVAVIDIFEYAVIYFISMRFMAGFNPSPMDEKKENASISFDDLPKELREKNKVFINLAENYEPSAFVPTFNLPKGSEFIYSRIDNVPAGERKFIIKNDRGDIQVTITPRHYSFFEDSCPNFILTFLFEFKSKYFFGSEKNQNFVHWAENFALELKSEFSS